MKAGKKYVLNEMFEFNLGVKDISKKDFFDRFEISFGLMKKLAVKDLGIDLKNTDRVPAPGELMTGEEFVNEIAIMDLDITLNETDRIANKKEFNLN